MARHYLHLQFIGQIMQYARIEVISERDGCMRVVWEGSANRDETDVRRRSMEFDVTVRTQPPPRVSVTACTSASGRTSPAWRIASYSEVLPRGVFRERRADRRPGGVDAQQPSHRHPPPAGPARTGVTYVHRTRR